MEKVDLDFEREVEIYRARLDKYPGERLTPLPQITQELVKMSKRKWVDFTTAEWADMCSVLASLLRSGVAHTNQKKVADYYESRKFLVTPDEDETEWEVAEILISLDETARL